MLRLATATAILGVFLLTVVPAVRSEEQRAEFIEALRRAGYYDMVVAYIERQLSREGLSETEREGLAFELAQALLDAASHEPDLQKRAAYLDRAADALRAYLEKYPEGTYAANAQFELARLEFERGRLYAAEAAAARSPQLALQAYERARAAFDQAKERFRRAAQLFEQRLKQFPIHIEANRTVVVGGRRIPGREARRLRQEAEINRILAQFHEAMVDYEYAHTYPEGSAAWREKLEAARGGFQRVFELYRTFLVGLHARMWMARCLDELGETRQALGLYEELLRHDPSEQTSSAARQSLVDLQREARYLWIVAQNKLGNYELALEAAREWLRQNRRLRYSETGQGVLWELARAAREMYTALPENSPQRRALLSEAINAWAELARLDSRYRDLAVAELQRWAGMQAAGGRSELTFAAAVSLASQALEEESWQKAAELYREALLLRDQAENEYQLNDARLRYAYALYRLGRRLDAAVVASHVALRYPDSGLARNAAYLALVALWAEYREALSDGNRVASDGLVPRLESLARLIVDKWGASTEADFARVVLGHLAWRRKQWDEAARWYEGVSPRSESYVVSMLRAAEAWWQVYMSQPRSTPESRTALERCRSVAEAARAAFGDVTTAPPEERPPELAQAELLLARVALEQGDVARARSLLEPYFIVLYTREDLASLRVPLLTTLLQAHLMEGDLAAAERLLAMLEQQEARGISDLMAALADRLADEAERLLVAGEVERAEERASAFASLVQRLVADGNIAPDTLFAFVSGLVKLGQHDAAVEAATKLVEMTRGDRSRNRAARLLLARALRAGGRYEEAARLLLGPDRRTGLLAENPRALDAIMEYGRVLTWWGLEDPQRLDQALSHWNRYARLMGLAARRPNEYYVAWAYLVLTELARARAGRSGSAERAGALARYALRTSPPTDLSRPVEGDNWRDVLDLARRLGITELPGELSVRQLLETLASAATVRS